MYVGFLVNYEWVWKYDLFEWFGREILVGLLFDCVVLFLINEGYLLLRFVIVFSKESRNMYKFNGSLWFLRWIVEVVGE